jgi:hypothetical protein
MLMISLVAYGTQIDFKHLTQKAQFKITDDEVHEMYTKIVAASGQTQDALRLYINDADTINAYNDGSSIVIYRGLINYVQSKDELALVVAHEVAHGMLQHLGKLHTNIPSEVAVLENNADKYGAILMMKAGYDVCLGRNLFLRWSASYGNALNQDHPPHSFRYAELNIKCSGGI